MKTKCSYCYNELDEEEIEYPRTDETGDIICDNCFKENYQDYCPLCEEHYDTPTKPEETFFVISKESESKAGVEAGFYKVKSWPYWVGATGLGFQWLNESAIQLIKKFDINSVLKKLYGKNTNTIEGDQICEECFNKYTNLKYKRIDYCDPWTKIHSNIYERGLIKEGK